MAATASPTTRASAPARLIVVTEPEQQPGQDQRGQQPAGLGQHGQRDQDRRHQQGRGGVGVGQRRRGPPQPGSTAAPAAAGAAPRRSSPSPRPRARPRPTTAVSSRRPAPASPPAAQAAAARQVATAAAGSPAASCTRASPRRAAAQPANPSQAATHPTRWAGARRGPTSTRASSATATRPSRFSELVRVEAALVESPVGESDTQRGRRPRRRHALPAQRTRCVTARHLTVPRTSCRSLHRQQGAGVLPERLGSRPDRPGSCDPRWRTGAAETAWTCRWGRLSSPSCRSVDVPLPPPARPLTRRMLGWALLADAVPLYPLYALLFADSGLSGAQISALFAIWSAVGAGRRGAVRRAGRPVRPAHRAGRGRGPAGRRLRRLDRAGPPSPGSRSASCSGASAARSCPVPRRPCSTTGWPRSAPRPSTRGSTGGCTPRCWLAGLPAAVAATVLYAAGGFELVGWVSVGVCLAAAAVAAPAAGARPHRRRPGDDELGYLATLRAGVAEAAARPGVPAARAGGRPGRRLRRDRGVLPADHRGARGADGRGAAGHAADRPGRCARGRARRPGEPAAAGRAGRAAGRRHAAARAGRRGSGTRPGWPPSCCSTAAYQRVLVVVDARLQQRIESRSRATVTSVAGLGVELATFGIYAAWAVGEITAVAAVGVLLAAALPWLLRRRSGAQSRNASELCATAVEAGCCASRTAAVEPPAADGQHGQYPSRAPHRSRPARRPVPLRTVAGDPVPAALAGRSSADRPLRRRGCVGASARTSAGPGRSPAGPARRAAGRSARAARAGWRWRPGRWWAGRAARTSGGPSAAACPATAWPPPRTASFRTVGVAPCGANMLPTAVPGLVGELQLGPHPLQVCPHVGAGRGRVRQARPRAPRARSRRGRRSTPASSRMPARRATSA